MNEAFTRFAQNKKNVEILFNHMNDGLMITNSRREIVIVNPAFERITGYTMKEVEGKNPNLLQSGNMPRDTYEEMWDCIGSVGSWTGELQNLRKDGSLFWSFITITKVKQNQSEDCYYIGILRDITARKNQEDKLKYYAYHDILTKLPNRMFFTEALQLRLSTAKFNQEKLAILFLDLDRFKKINDSLGHQFGDDLLIQMANRIKTVIGDHGIVSRFGGDEFTVCLPFEEEHQVTTTLEKLTDQFRQPFVIHERAFYMTISIGMSIFPEHGSDVETLLKNADTAMYVTKEEGRDHFSIYEAKMNEKTSEQFSLEVDLVEALAQDQLEVYYQLQVDVDNEKPFGVEALIRWNHPTKGMLSPAEFLNVAEEIGILANIDEWVLKQAINQGKKWHEQGYPNLVISVNISRDFFKKADFLNKVNELLDDSRLNPARLCLEVTENFAVLHVEEIRNKLISLKERGIRVSLDDFGTGYSSLNQLNLFPIDTLKIDQSFVRGNDSKENGAIIKLIIALAKSLGVSVICEGIETAEQLSLIKNEGCDHAQGYLFSKPVPFDKCETMMHALTH
ncbi:putative bifunctional diguanylate cyclase/phosphodiesterase [Halalkalibacter akibai]|uniref:Diguanylate cyclase/phosphodiesterase n=1 Tax=Halalkalibacter akibai (strain ATCC 43226 / DSM 21942 / CIP 109018 / JCM 9157 / 1139) TaxID=1236973 RepID=W4QNH0_HALA3|nr:EAL domain-containing protein [Halalkalibacter akibai]GAE33660.1 diguanylate cyclase/phosphodiesterase [Halalkalibacter akibai JCM 9157]